MAKAFQQLENEAVAPAKPHLRTPSGKRTASDLRKTHAGRGSRIVMTFLSSHIYVVRPNRLLDGQDHQECVIACMFSTNFSDCEVEDTVGKDLIEVAS